MKYPIVENEYDFDQAVIKFENFEPVKVSRDLRVKFERFITQHFLLKSVIKWHYTTEPQKKSYKFTRTLK
jgi:succinate dehydrogenase/fumarate reductase-like Fe-S protein